MNEAELVRIYLYDNQVLFHPVVPCVEQALTVQKKEIKNNEIVTRPVRCWYTTIQDGKEIGISRQGFWGKIMRTLMKHKYNVRIQDMRNATGAKGFPEPRFDLMYGFRYSQEELLKKALSIKRSGLIGAPTRYGKSVLITNVIRAYPTLTICVVAPGVDLVKQLHADLTCKFGVKDRVVHLVCGTRKLKNIRKGDVVVCSADSVRKIDTTAFDLLLADEVHELVTETRLPAIDSFTRARRIGFGATLTGRFDGMDMMVEGLFGPILAERTYKEAVAEGAICPLKVIFVKIEIAPHPEFFTRNTAYNRLFFQNRTMAGYVRDICRDVIPEDMQTLIFIKHEKQADLYQDIIGKDTCIAMAKKLTMKERDEVMDKLKNNVVKRCLCSKIYAKGVTFSDVRVLINAEAGGNNTSAIQKPGRLAEVRPGKKCGVIIDFWFETAANTGWQEPWRSLVIDSINRKKAYEDKGYDIMYCKPEELKTLFDSII